MVSRWKFRDPSMDGVMLDPFDEWKRDWTVPQNPAEMSSPFPEKNIQIHTTTAINGQVLLYEGQPSPVEWTFSGSILTPEHYERLLYWSRKRVRTLLTDHFGREFQIYLTRFDPTPRRGGKRYWRHEYTMRALVLKAPTAPTVGV